MFQWVIPRQLVCDWSILTFCLTAHYCLLTFDKPHRIKISGVIWLSGKTFELHMCIFVDRFSTNRTASNTCSRPRGFHSRRSTSATTRRHVTRCEKKRESPTSFRPPSLTTIHIAGSVVLIRIMENFVNSK